MQDYKNEDELAISTIKISGVAAVNSANSGHPGIVLGAAKISHTLFTKHLNFDPKNPKWINRDRFVLSAGHGSALLYAQLRLLNLISTEDLKKFRHIGSITPGHPEFGLTNGVEATTGPLGQGIAMSVGMAVAEESLRARFKEIDHYTYVLCGDGDLQEGVAMESLSFAGAQNLSKLIVIQDSNDIQLDTAVNKVFKENLKQRMESINFEYIKVENNNVDEIDKAISKAKSSNKPTFIEVKTIIGEGSTNQGTTSVHGAPLGKDISSVRENLNWKEDDFFIPEEVKNLYQKTIFKRGKEKFENFEASKELEEFLKVKPININLDLDKNMATRNSSGKIVQYIGQKRLNWIGGSADLSCSTKVAGEDGDFSKENRKGRNILFGVREFAMGAIGNGIALHSNFKPFVSTFFIFADYVKPAIRLSALMNLPITYAFTHDSVFVGEDGPTHQPIEQIAMIRSIPNINFIRPSDEKEVLGAYELAYNSTKTPTIIALTRQNIKSLENTSKDLVQKGNYKILNNNSKWTICASGSELNNAFEIGKELNINVVSISNFKGNIDWDIKHAITIEAGTTYGMKKYGFYNFGINTFGESGEGSEVYKHFGLNRENLLKEIKKIIDSK